VTLGQLTYFIAVAETGSFTLAARREHVAQPSLSQQIRALERELGGPVFERRANGVKLTAAGSALLPKARTAVRASRDGRFLAAQAAAGGADAVCVAALPGAPISLLAEALARVRADRPGLAARVHLHAEQERLEEKLRDGEGTLALAGPPSHGWDGPVLSLGERELVLVTTPGDEASDGVPLADLADRSWIALDDDDSLELAGIEPASLVRTSHVDGALALVGAGVGVALLDAGAIGPESALQAVRLADPPRREWVVFAHGAWSPPAVDLVAALVTLTGAPANVA
jgi:DNA-binding transcriptional LysR family regulator